MTHFFDLYFYKSINNTNDKLKEIRLVNPDRNIALFSAEQIKGKGRSGRVWISNEGDLTCSFLINQSISFKDIGKINIIFVNILFNFFRNFNSGNSIKYKWPNDIQINNRKISGILIETFSNYKNIESFIVGIGVNLISSPTIVSNKTISLAELNIKIEPIDAFFLLQKEVISFFKEFNNLNFLSLSKNLNLNFYDNENELNINLKNNIVKGTFKEINTHGELILNTLDKRNRKISYGEII
ncbi:MAG: biotin--[acetyl-CoA-carboxylase] ligase [Alphaproteobacteria bacterium]